MYANRRLAWLGPFGALFLVLLLSMAWGLAARGANERTKIVPTDPRQMAQRIEALEAQVDQLTARLETVQVSRIQTISPFSAGVSPELPSGSTRYTFNGMQQYWVPCDEGDRDQSGGSQQAMPPLHEQLAPIAPAPIADPAPAR